METLIQKLPTEVLVICFYGNRDCSTSLLVDLAVLVVQYSPDQDGVVSLPLPSSLVLASGCQRQSVVTCSGFLEQGHYAILPLSFTYWCCDSSLATPPSHPYVVALYSGREVLYHPHSLTRPGFLTEALFLLTNNRHILATVRHLPVWRHALPFTIPVCMCVCVCVHV